MTAAREDWGVKKSMKVWKLFGNYSFYVNNINYILPVA